MAINRHALERLSIITRLAKIGDIDATRGMKKGALTLGNLARATAIRVTLRGEIRGYKKVYDGNEDPILATLIIPFKATVVHAGKQSKCRTNVAKVLALHTIEDRCPSFKMDKKNDFEQDEKHFPAIPEDECDYTDYLTLTSRPLMAYSGHDTAFVYRPGKIVRPQYPLSINLADDCGSGLHFFLDLEDALNY